MKRSSTYRHFAYFGLILTLHAWVPPASHADGFRDELGFIDYRALEQHFARNVTRLHEENALADRETLSRQLEAEATYELTSSASAGRYRDFADLYRERVQSVVGVGSTYLCGHCDQPHASLASGVIIHKDGYVLTNYHVLEKSERSDHLAVMLYDGRVFPVLEILASNRRDDVALMRIDATGLPASPIAKTASVGDILVVISHPDTRYFVMSMGALSGMFTHRTPLGPVRRLSITADFARGSSGGPIFNDKGEIVGIVHSTNTVYYQPRTKESVQMVWKNIVPYASILEILSVQPTE